MEGNGAERFAGMPRPLNYIRVRLYRGGQVEYIRDVLEDERDQLYEDLAKMRAEKKPEDGPDITECTANIRHLNSAIRDIANGYTELVGPEPAG